MASNSSKIQNLIEQGVALDLYRNPLSKYSAIDHFVHDEYIRVAQEKSISLYGDGFYANELTNLKKRFDELGIGFRYSFSSIHPAFNDFLDTFKEHLIDGSDTVRYEWSISHAHSLDYQEFIESYQDDDDALNDQNVYDEWRDDEFENQVYSDFENDDISCQFSRYNLAKSRDSILNKIDSSLLSGKASKTEDVSENLYRMYFDYLSSAPTQSSYDDSYGDDDDGSYDDYDDSYDDDDDSSEDDSSSDDSESENDSDSYVEFKDDSSLCLYLYFYYQRDTVNQNNLEAFVEALHKTQAIANAAQKHIEQIGPCTILPTLVITDVVSASPAILSTFESQVFSKFKECFENIDRIYNLLAARAPSPIIIPHLTVERLRILSPYANSFDLTNANFDDLSFDLINARTYNHHKLFYPRGLYNQPLSEDKPDPHRDLESFFTDQSGLNKYISIKANNINRFFFLSHISLSKLFLDINFNNVESVELITDTSNVLVNDKFSSSLRDVGIFNDVFKKCLNIDEHLSDSHTLLNELLRGYKTIYSKRSDTLYLIKLAPEVLTAPGLIFEHNILCTTPPVKIKKYNLNDNINASIFNNPKELTDAPSVSDPQNIPFANYIGFKNIQSAKFYKDSNFIAYSYLYMYIPQILNRFEEHLQNERISQEAPLSLSMPFYDSDEASDDPQVFLKRGLEKLKQGLHPLYQPKGYLFSDTLVPLNEILKSDNSQEMFHMGIGYLYSFIDYYTRPLALLYNAPLRKGARSNPFLDKSQPNRAGNFDTSNFVEEYKKLIADSQNENFVANSRLRELTTQNVTLRDIESEIDYFIENANVWEYSELQTLQSHFNSIYKNHKNELPMSFIRSDENAYSLLQNIIPKNKDEYEFISDNKGIVRNTPFMKQMNTCMQVISKFYSKVVSTMFSSNFKKTQFYTLHLVGKDVPHIEDLSGLLSYAAYSTALKKILKNPTVTIADGATAELCLAQRVKGAIPYKGIHYSLRQYDRKPPYSYLGVDGQQPQRERLSLGAFLSIYSWLRAALNFSTVAKEYMGPVQASSIGGRHEFYVYQPGLEEEGVVAEFDTIRSRFGRLSTKYVICIGQSDKYALEVVDGELQVFVFINERDVNISTMGISVDSQNRYEMYDVKGENNTSPLLLFDNSEDYVFFLRWIEDLAAFTMFDNDEDELSKLVEFICTKDESDLTSASKFATNEESNFFPNKIDFKFKDKDGFLEGIVSGHKIYLPNIYSVTDINSYIDYKFGAFKWFAGVIKDKISEKFNQSTITRMHIDAICDILSNQYDLFEMLFCNIEDDIGSWRRLRNSKFTNFKNAVDSIDIDRSFAPQINV